MHHIHEKENILIRPHELVVEKFQLSNNKLLIIFIKTPNQNI